MNNINIVLAAEKVIPTAKNAVVIGNSLGHDLTLNHGQYHHLNTKTLVEGVGPCARLMMWAGKHKFDAHTAPELEPLEGVRQQISTVVENLRSKIKNSFDEVHAFITGGIEYNSQNPVSKQSLDLIEEMYEAMQKEGVPTTVIACQRGDGLKTRLNSLSYQENIFVTGKPIDNVINSKNSSLEDTLNEYFDFVEISDTPIKIIK